MAQYEQGLKVQRNQLQMQLDMAAQVSLHLCWQRCYV